jgi:peptide/nickel transport system permease protein
MLSRIIYGSRLSLQVGIVAVGIAIIIGSLLGLFAGYYGGWLDNVVMRLMDIMLAFPSILLAIVVVAALGPNLFNAMIAVSIVSIPAYARILRASVLTIREREYVLAAKALGANDLRIITTAVLPNCLAPLIVQATLGMGTAILDAAGLSFLGLGARPPAPEWGAMLNENFWSMRVAPWTVTTPGVAILLVVLGFNLLGDGLRDIMDPQLITRRGNKKKH